MSQHEEDSYLLADALADLVDANKLDDPDAIAYLAGTASHEVKSKINKLLEEIG